MGNNLVRLMIAAVFAMVLVAALPAFGQSHVIEVLADKDSRFKIAGQSKAEITVKARDGGSARYRAQRQDMEP